MNITKRVISTFLALVLLCGVLPYEQIGNVLAVTETDASAFEYTVTGGNVTIKKYIGSDTEVVIPSVIEGLPVTKIGKEAFYKRASLMISVVIPEDVTSIGESGIPKT